MATSQGTVSNIVSQNILEQLDLISANGNRISLKMLFQNMNIYYGITNTVFTGKLVFRDDMFNLLNTLPICGQEKLEVSFKMGNGDNSSVFKRTFYVIGVDNVLNNQDLSLVTLSFADIIGYVNTDFRLSYQFGGYGAGDNELGAYNILKKIETFGAVKDFNSYDKTNTTNSVSAKANDFFIHYNGNNSETKVLFELDKDDKKQITETYGKFKYTASNQTLLSVLRHVTELDAENYDSGFCDCVLYQNLKGKFVLSSFKKLYSNDIAFIADYTPRNNNGIEKLNTLKNIQTTSKAISEIQLEGKVFDLVQMRNMGAFGMTANMIDVQNHGSQGSALYYTFYADEILQRTSVSYVNKKCGDTKAVYYPNSMPAPVFSSKFEKYNTVIYPANSLTDGGDFAYEEEYMKKYVLKDIGKKYQSLIRARFVFEYCNDIDVGDMFFINDNNDASSWFSGYWLVTDCTINIDPGSFNTIVVASKNYYPFGGKVNTELNPYVSKGTSESYIARSGDTSYRGTFAYNNSTTGTMSNGASSAGTSNKPYGGTSKEQAESLGKLKYGQAGHAANKLTVYEDGTIGAPSTNVIDCSQLVSLMATNMGVMDNLIYDNGNCPTSHELANKWLANGGSQIAWQDAEEGDLVYYPSQSRTSGHVGIITVDENGNKYITETSTSASNKGLNTVVSRPLNSSYYGFSNKYTCQIIRKGS